MNVTPLPFELKKKRTFIAGGFAVYCNSMLYAVGIAERLHLKFRKEDFSCPLWGSVEFRGETFYWIRFAFLRFPGAYKGQNQLAAGDHSRSV